MYAKIVVSAVLVSILPCESQHQRFFAIPFENNDESVLKPHQSHQLIRNNHFVTERSRHNGNFRGSLRHNNNFLVNSIVSNTEPQLNFNQEHLNDNFGRDFNGKDSHVSAINQNQFQSFPTGTDLTINQPIRTLGILENQDPTSVLTQQINENTEDQRQLLNSVIRPKEPTTKPINSYLSVEEPTLTLIEDPRSTSNQIRPVNSQTSFRNQQQTFTQFPQQTHTQISSFIQPAIHQQFGSQVSQPQIQDHISSRFSNQPQQVSFAQQPSISQQFQTQFPSQIPQPTHRPRIHRPVSRNNQPSVNLNPQLSQHTDFIVNAQPDEVFPTSVHRFASPINTGSNLRVQSGSHISKKTNRDFDEEVFRKQAESAQYSFASQIDDSINGNQHQREEVRDGVNVKGMYSYSDGYVKRTVYYEADDKGYRVVKEEEEPLGDGPQFNPKGQANVSSFVAGNAVQYSITSADIPNRNQALKGTTSI